MHGDMHWLLHAILQPKVFSHSLEQTCQYGNYIKGYGGQAKATVHHLPQLWRTKGIRDPWRRGTSGHTLSLSVKVSWENLQQHTGKTMSPSSISSMVCWGFILRFYLFIFREGKGRRKRGRETSVCGSFSLTPHWGPGPQSRHVLRLGIEPAILWFRGQHSVHWAIPARADLYKNLKK